MCGMQLNAMRCWNALTVSSSSDLPSRNSFVWSYSSAHGRGNRRWPPDTMDTHHTLDARQIVQGFNATTIWMVEQFRFCDHAVMLPRRRGSPQALTNGTSSSMRKRAGVVDHHGAGRGYVPSRISFDTLAPQENSAISTPSNDSGAISCTVSSPAGTWPHPKAATSCPPRRAGRQRAHLGRREIELCSTCKNSSAYRARGPCHSHHRMSRNLFRPCRSNSPFPAYAPYRQASLTRLRN